MNMTLEQWLAGRNMKAYIFARQHGLPMSVIYKLKRGGKVAYETAERISKATDGELSVMEIYRPNG